MDRIMPIDLERPALRKGFRGYDVAAVDALLARTAATLVELLAENGRLREQNEIQKAEVERFRADEGLLRDALVLAQRTADETRASAQRHAEVILEEARQAALAERMAVQQKVSELRWEFDRLRVDRDRFVAETRALLERQLRELEAPPLSVVEGSAAQA